METFSLCCFMYNWAHCSYFLLWCFIRLMNCVCESGYCGLWVRQFLAQKYAILDRTGMYCSIKILVRKSCCNFSIKTNNLFDFLIKYLDKSFYLLYNNEKALNAQFFRVLNFVSSNYVFPFISQSFLKRWEISGVVFEFAVINKLDKKM